MKSEQHYTDLLPEEAEPALKALVQELDAAYTAPQRPVGLSWTTASQRLRLVEQHPSNVEMHLSAKSSRRMSIGRGVRWLMTAAALLLMLVAAGFASPLSHGPGSGASAPIVYAAINQSMLVADAVTLTATKGYVDPKHLVLYFDAQLSDSLENRFVGPIITRSSIQGKDVKSINWGFLQGGTTAHGALIVPSGGDITGKTLQVVWHITEIVLIPKVAGGTPLLLKGDWTFRFSIPFHHEVQDPLQLDFPGFNPMPVN